MFEKKQGREEKKEKEKGNPKDKRVSGVSYNDGFRPFATGAILIFPSCESSPLSLVR